MVGYSDTYSNIYDPAIASTRFFASSFFPFVTASFSVPLGGTPSIGDQVFVFLGVDNEIVTHQPNYNKPTQWAQILSTRGRNTSTLSSWQHTWTGADSGSSVTFSVSPAPKLGVGDKDLPSANVLAVAVVLRGPIGASESLPATSYDVGPTVTPGPLKKAHDGALVASYAVGSTGFTVSDPLTLPVTTISGGGSTLTVFGVDAINAGYRTGITASAPVETLAHVASVNNNPSFIYNPGLIYEGPVSEDALLFRYTLARYYTLLNNAGTFTQTRYASTDQLNAATQVFTNNSPVSSTDRTNILNSGVGGEFVSA